MTRVAFTIFGGDGWTGGINYLRNLVSALAELPGRPVTPVLFVAPDTPVASLAEITPYLSQPPVVVAGWAGDPATRRQRLWQSSVLQNDRVSAVAFERESIDVVFVHAAWYGLRFTFPTLAWIADFQHRHLPQMFSLGNRLKRDFGYAALSRCATAVMLSSEDARRDCERFYVHTQGRTCVLPFAVRMDPSAIQGDATVVADRYQLPERFFYLPNQLWKHKNHIQVLKALRLLQQRGIPVVVAASGNPKDSRNPTHPERVLSLVHEWGLVENFRFLGLIPYADLMPLMRASVAVVNPSLFEGWSTTVEEAKALGVPLLLSDLAVHREQTQAGEAQYFDPHSPESIADALALAWQRPPTERVARESSAINRYKIDRERFAARFASIVAALSISPISSSPST